MDTGKDTPIALETRNRADDARLFSPSAGRNQDVVTQTLSRFLPENGRALEVGSGTGEHVTRFASAARGVHFHPSDPDAASRASIAAWTAHHGLSNVEPPTPIDVTAADWSVETFAPFDAIISLNMIHIAPWEAGLGLIAGARRLLEPGGFLFLYGPFSRGGAHTAPSNADFDASLKARDPRWGVRDLDQVEAAAIGFRLDELVTMPANNYSVILRRV